MTAILTKPQIKILAVSVCSIMLFLSLKNALKTSTESKNFTVKKTWLRIGKCQPNKDVLFLKTHKTGSSTLTNILNRYCDTHGLIMAIPKDGFFNYFWPLPFDGNFVAMKDVNMLANHARFSKEMVAFMPSRTSFITILRYPSTQFESLFSYMDFAGLFKLRKYESPINTFLENPLFHVRNFMTHGTADLLIQNPHVHLLKNGQFFDLGLDDDSNDRTIRKAIVGLEKQFHLVLIMEYFDESLVLLARKLCWELADVIYFKQNQRILAKTVSRLTPKAEQTFRQWNKADFMLYNHFNRTFWKKVNQQDKSFWQDVKLLKGYNNFMAKQCLVPGNYLGSVYEGQSKSIRGFKLKSMLSPELRRICEQLITSEIDYIKYFKQKYYP